MAIKTAKELAGWMKGVTDLPAKQNKQLRVNALAIDAMGIRMDALEKLLANGVGEKLGATV